MTKKLIVLIAAAAFIGGMSSAALAKNEGTVTAVKGDVVSIEMSGKDAKAINVGDNVTLKVKKSKAAKAGADALTGC